MKINSILNFKETLIFKYACIIGTIFDLQTLDKLNPLYSIIKMKDLEKVIEKLDKEHIIEKFSDFKNLDKRKHMFCKISFPFMREVFQQKFPIEYRKILHMKVAKIISTDNNINYFSTENNILILQRHLLISETDVVSETESKNIKTVKDVMQNRQKLNYNNLKILLVKELYSRFCYPTSNSVLEGNLELYFKPKWLRISYYIDLRGKIYFNQKEYEKGTLTNILIFSIENIYKNHILKNVDETKYKCANVLEISVSTTSKPLEKNNKKNYYFRSEQREELCKLDIAINFLRVKVNYENFRKYYGELRFPLYRLKWFVKNKVNKYYANLEPRKMNKRISIYNLDSSYSDNILNETKNYFKSFRILIKTSLSIFLGTIQENITIKQKKANKKGESIILPIFPKSKITYDFLKYFTIPLHLSNRINKHLKFLEQKGIISNQPDNYDFENYVYQKLMKKLNDNPSNKNLLSEKADKSKTKRTSKNSSKKPIKKKRKNKTVEKENLKSKKIDNEDKPIILKKQNKKLEEDVTFSDYNSKEKNLKSISPNNKTEENSLDSILNELLDNKQIKIEINDIHNNNINTNKSRNPKKQKQKVGSYIPVNDKITLPGDFVPLTERTEDRSHLQLIDTRSTKVNEKQNGYYIYDFDAKSLMSNYTDINYFKKELKFKTLSDDPKYVYIEANQSNQNKKVHKSNLFVNVKHNKRKNKIND